ncbi:MAG: hypothetical protein V1813_03680 [Candidatus Aenigmatarchaeota archaeon]
MEYLMTYGWAILIVIIVAAALYSLGIFNPATWTGSRATGFTNMGAPAAGAWKLGANGAADQFQLVLKNNLPSRISVTGVNVTIGITACDGEAINSVAVQGSGGIPEGIGTGFTVTANCGTQTAGSSYTSTVSLTYNNLDTGLTALTESGSLTGTVTS